jgi:ABC-2 type transport system ATP-binding protein
MELIIENLSKTYSNGVQALKNVSLHIPSGMFGLLGPNGAGKSSLMRTLATLQEADSGTAMLGDMNILNNKEGIRKVLGYLPQEFGVYPKVSAETMLDQFAQLKGISNSGERKEVVESLLHKTNLYQFRKRNIGTYSGGMKQRFGIAQALLGSPKLIIVDEPTAGLDPSERNRFHNLLSEIGENIVVILSTHIIEDVQSLCSNMAIINKGEVLISGKPLQVIESIKGKVWRKIIDKYELPNYAHLKVISNKLSVGKTELNVFSDTMPEAGFTRVEPNLEDVYFSSILS